MRLIVSSGFLIRQILEKEPAKDQPFLAGEFRQGQPVPAFIYIAYGNCRFSDQASEQALGAFYISSPGSRSA
jgi:hypothetical protein